jgi:hypothetical protein
MLVDVMALSGVANHLKAENGEIIEESSINGGINESVAAAIKWR